MKKRRILYKEPKEEIIDLTDMGNHNKTSVIRADNTRSILDPKSEHVGTFDSTGIIVIPEDKGYIESKLERQATTPEDPDGNYEEQLEAEGAFIIDSTTYFPASGTTVTRKSQTPAEIAEERGYHDFIER